MRNTTTSDVRRSAGDQPRLRTLAALYLLVPIHTVCLSTLSIVKEGTRMACWAAIVTAR